MPPVAPWSKPATVTPWSIQVAERVIKPWERRATSAFPLIANARLWTPSNFSDRYLMFLEDRLKLAVFEDKTTTYFDAIDAIAAFRDFGHVVVDKDGSVWFGPYQSLRSATATGSRVDLESFTPLPALSFGSAGLPCDNSQFTPLDGTHLICVRKFSSWNEGLTGVAISIPDEILNSGDVGRLAEFLLTSGGVNDGAEMSFDAWTETKQALLALHHAILHDIMGTERPFTLKETSYVPLSLQIPAGGGGEDQELQKRLAAPSLPAEDAERIRAAGVVFAGTVLLENPSWLAGIPEATGKMVMQGMLALGLYFGNFGRVQIGPGAVKESNNFFLLSDPDEPGPACEGPYLWDSLMGRCIYAFATVGEGATFFLNGISMPVNVALQQALLSGDIGRLAEALIRAGYLSPAQATLQLWQSVEASLEQNLSTVASALGSVNLWQETTYQPDLPTSETPEPPEPAEPAEETTGKGWKSYLIAGALMGAGAAIFYAGYKAMKEQKRAANPIEDAELLRMARSDREAERMTAATHATSPELLWKLAKDDSEGVRRMVATSPNIGSDIVEKLMVDSDVNVRIALVRNPKVPGHVLNAMAKDPSPMVRAMVARAEELPHLAAERLVSDSDDQVRKALASNPRASAAALDKLANDSWVMVRVEVAKNPNLSDATMRRLSTDAGAYVREALASREDLPRSIVETLRQHGTVMRDEKDFLRRLEDPSTPAKELGEWANHQDVAIATRALRNPSVPAKVLTKFSKHPGMMHRLAVARNPSASAKILAILSTDDSVDVRSAVASNEKTPKDILHNLAYDERDDVVESVALNPNTPASTLKYMATERDFVWEVRKAVAENISTDLGTVRLLMNDPDEDVATAARERVEAEEDIAAAEDEAEAEIDADQQYQDIYRFLRDVDDDDEATADEYDAATKEWQELVGSTYEIKAWMKAGADPFRDVWMVRELAERSLSASDVRAATTGDEPTLFFQVRNDDMTIEEAIARIIAMKSSAHQTQMTPMTEAPPPDIEIPVLRPDWTGEFPTDAFERYALLAQMASYAHNAFEVAKSGADLKSLAQLLKFAYKEFPKDYFALLMRRVILAAFEVDGVDTNQIRVSSPSYDRLKRVLRKVADGQEMLDAPFAMVQRGLQFLSVVEVASIFDGQGDGVAFPEQESARIALLSQLLTNRPMHKTLNALRWYATKAPVDYMAFAFEEALRHAQVHGGTAAADLRKAIAADPQLNQAERIARSFAGMARGERYRNPV